MNSFRSVERAIDFEIARQAAALDAGEAIRQETRGWSDDRGVTYRMRSKETSDDYRYFPEPDLPPLHVDPAWLADLRGSMPELPAARRVRYETQLGLSAYDASVLAADPDATMLFEATIATRDGGAGVTPKAAANWVSGEYLRLRKVAIDDAPIQVNAMELATIIRAVEDGMLSRSNGKEVLELHATTGAAASTIIVERGYRQITDTDAVGAAVDAVLAANPAAIADYRAGKEQAVGFLVGQVMKATRGQANAALVQVAVRAQLDAAE